MNVQFCTLFTLSPAHGFYTGPSRDFAYGRPADTAALLRNGRLLARELEGTLHVLFEADGDENPLRPIAGSTLRIGMQLLNPNFANFTALPAGFPARRLRYTNQADATVLAPADAVALVPETFAHTLGGAARPVTVALRTEGGTVLGEDTVAADDGRTALSYELPGVPPGALEVEETYPGDVTARTALYLDPELRRRDAAVVVEVTVDAGFYADPPELTVPFAPRMDVLSYYVVAGGHSAQDLDLLSVTDEGAGLDGRDPVAFTKVAGNTLAQPDLEAWMLAPGHENEVLCFRSTAPVARRERGRRRIQLARNGDVLMANLPQPGVERAQADLILHLSKP